MAQCVNPPRRLVTIRPVREFIRTTVVRNNTQRDPQLAKQLGRVTGHGRCRGRGDFCAVFHPSTAAHDMQPMYRELGLSAGPTLVARLEPVGSVTCALVLGDGTYPMSTAENWRLIRRIK